MIEALLQSEELRVKSEEFWYAFLLEKLLLGPGDIWVY